MANFTIPFGQDAERRFPTSDERQNGFPCGPADMRLFNGLFNTIQSEIGEVISYAGLVGSDGDLTQLRKAIKAMIDAAMGGGSPGDYILMDQARARLPIFPEVQTGDGRIAVVPNGAGVVRVPAGATILHRGIFPIVTVQTDLATDVSKTYHLRWNPTDGFQLKDLANPTYNPTAASEDNVGFDSKYDDMLVARVVSNSSNILTITNLANLVDLQAFEAFSGPATPVGAARSYEYQNTMTLNWARAPRLIAPDGVISQNGGLNEGNQAWIQSRSKSRYSVTAKVVADFWEGGPPTYSPTGWLNIAALG